MSETTRRLRAACVAVVFIVSTSTSARQSATSQLAPARDGLRAVPLPRLDDLEPAVSDQIRELQRAFVALVAAGSPSGRTLADAYGSLAQVFHVYEFFEAADAGYFNAMRLASGDARWPHLLGYLYQQTGRLSEAAEHFERAIRVQPDDRAATLRLGQVYLGQNRLREAREQFQSVLMVFPALAQNGLGEVALRERRFEEAVEYFDAALKRVPQASSIHYSLAMAYRGLGRMDQARSHLQQRGSAGITVGDPIVDGLQTLVRGERGLVVQGRRFYEAGQFKEAAAAFAKAIEAAPSSAPARVNLALTQLQLGNTTEALALLRSAFALAPDDADVSRELLRVLLRLGRKEEAIQVLTKTASLNPDDEETLVSLAILMAEQQRYLDAVTVLAEANQRFPARTATATTLARLLASSPDRSIRDGRRALDLAQGVFAANPSPVHGETVALALAELGRCDEALTWMKRAVAEAEQAKDVTEAARLRGELPKYESASCRQ
jgi:tetratricopeptide (TPR) repeat protein